ncbi:MAG: hypothetical protein GXO88_14390 [Chlorobi bacterium]|nr:hypothetical protein [Chlorobiota bacterium]
MKKVLQLLLLIFVPYLINAQTKINQNSKVEVGKPYPVIDAKLKKYLIHNDKLISFKFVKDKIIVQTFNTNSLSLETIRTYTDFPKKYVIEHIGIYFDKCLLFYSLWDKNLEKEQLFYRELDMETGQFIEKGKLLFRTGGKLTGTFTLNPGFYNFGVVDKFDFQSSYDDQYILIKYRKEPAKKNDNINYDVIGFHVYDIWMNDLWDKEVKMPYTEGKMDNLDYYINENADVFILARVFTDNSHAMKIKQGRANYRMELLKIEKDKAGIAKTSISLGNKLINSITLYQGSDNNLFIGGYYAKESISNADGLFCFNIDADGQLVNKMTYEFPLSFLNQNVSNKQQKKNNKKAKKDKAEFGFLHMTRISVSGDGSVTLIGEQSFTEVVYGAKHTYTNYYYNDMVISKIDANGKLLWNKRLPKFQKGRNSGKADMSFKHFYGNGNNYLLFLDNELNRYIKDDERPKVHFAGSRAWLAAYIINSETGEVSKNYILNSREIKGVPIYQFSTNRISKLSESEIIFEVYKKKKEDVLIKVKFW